MRAFVIGLAALVAVGGSAVATDITIPGKKLLIKNPPSGTANNKLVFLAKNASIVSPQGPLRDPTILGGYLHVSGAGGNFIISLPSGGWTANVAGNLYKYRDTTGTTCTVVVIKDEKLEKAVCRGTQVAYDLGAAQGAINVILGTGTDPLRHCHQFDAAAPESCEITKDGSDDKTYLAKNCAGATVGCQSPSGAFLDEPSAVF